MIGGKARGPVQTRSNQVLDTFQRASLGSNWTTYLGNVAIVGSADWGATSESGIHIAGYTAVTQGADQVIEAQMVAAPESSLMEAQIFGRRRAADVARYGFHYHVFDELWEIKYDGVASEFTRLLDTDAVAAPPTAGSVLRMELRGTGATVNIKCFHNGLQILEADDTHADRITTTGPTGLVTRAQTGQSPSYPVGVFSRFAAGTLLQ